MKDWYELCVISLFWCFWLFLCVSLVFTQSQCPHQSHSWLIILFQDWGLFHEWQQPAKEKSQNRLKCNCLNTLNEENMLIIGIAGGTGSGKTTVVNKIVEALPENSVAIIPQDSYYNDQSHLPLDVRRKTNFDHPSAFDWKLFEKQIAMLKHGKAIEQPTSFSIVCLLISAFNLVRIYKHILLINYTLNWYS